MAFDWSDSCGQSAVKVIGQKKVWIIEINSLNRYESVIIY